jgi:hypothetical protein
MREREGERVQPLPGVDGLAVVADDREVGAVRVAGREGRAVVTLAVVCQCHAVRVSGLIP